MITLRCSSLPLILTCHAAARSPDISVYERFPQTEAGTSAHTHLQEMVTTGSVEWSSIQTPEVRSLVAGGRRAWEDLRGLFAPHPLTETFMSAVIADGIILSGHPDVHFAVGSVARILDWKSGRVDHDYVEQLRGYAALVMFDDPAIERVEMWVVWLRDDEVVRYEMRRSELRSWCRRLERAMEAGDQYTTGTHCEYCPRSHECPGRAAMVRRDVSAFTELAKCDIAKGLASMPPERVIELVKVARMVSRTAERAVDAVRDMVATSGDIVASDGTRLTLATDRKRTINTAAAWDTLCEFLSPEELASCVDVRISRVEEAAAKKAQPRKGAAAKRAIAAALEEAGAVGCTETKRLVTRQG